MSQVFAGMPVRDEERKPAATVAELQSRLERAERVVEELLGALQWCSASPSFLPGGEAREGWLKLCAPLLNDETAAPGGQASERAG